MKVVWGSLEGRFQFIRVHLFIKHSDILCYRFVVRDNSGALYLKGFISETFIAIPSLLLWKESPSCTVPA